MRILIFGDSVTQGFFDSRGGWPNRLAAELHLEGPKNLKGDRPEVFSLGISGDMAGDVLARLESETKAREWEDEPLAIVLAVGINDAVLRDNRVIQDVYEFQETYEKLLDRALKLSNRVLAVGLNAVDERRTDPWVGSVTKKQWLNNRIDLFEDTIKQAAHRAEVPVVHVYDQFADELTRQDILADGLHPNDAGHELIAALVRPELIKTIS